MQSKLFNSIRFFSIVLIFGSSYAQNPKGIIGQQNWLQNWTNFKSSQTNYRDAKILVSGTIDKNTTFTRDKTYLLVGDVYVTKNAVLTIEPGTQIRGDYQSTGTLIIAANSKIIAEGTESSPIIFTSNKDSERAAGDWGGIIILGDAPINKIEGVWSTDLAKKTANCKFGGTNQNSNSGILKFVRIEYAGKRISKTKSLNALALHGVGSKTIIDNVQVSFSNDDAVEIKGGNLTLNNIVTFKTIDDDFDVSMGAIVKVNNSLIVRDPLRFEESKSRAFEVESFDKDDAIDENANSTIVEVVNSTVLNLVKDEVEIATEAIFIHDHAKFMLKNSVISGFKRGIYLSNIAAINPNVKYNIFLSNVLINNCSTIIDAETTYNESASFAADLQSEVLRSSDNTKSVAFTAKMIFKNLDFKEAPDLRLKANDTVVSK
jgi:hypothetical protein